MVLFATRIHASFRDIGVNYQMPPKDHIVQELAEKIAKCLVDNLITVREDPLYGTIHEVDTFILTPTAGRHGIPMSAFLRMARTL